ncbi:MAG: PD-(D/E)XK nuclease family transposase [Acidobacteria bacterium]|nr:PD-(D/E)XK nuclease family transposase [Acidobacteriota bacterium]MBI3421627.1 PD-(D/E)XK nuclease family transposase [Acidobacteriota bacterium]
MAVTEKYLNPFTDFGFKRLFGSEPNKDLLIDFLNQLLPPQHQIQELTYARNELLGDTRLDRGAVFDIYCVSPSGEHFIVEMQKARQLFFKDRNVFYATWPIREQGRRGDDWNYQLTPVYLIGILDFVFTENKDDTEVCHRVQLKDQTNRVFYDKLLLIYLEMPKFTKTEDELETPFDKWLYVLKHLPKLTARPAKLQERIFGKLLAAAAVENFDHEELQAYENSLKHYRDSRNVVETAVIEGATKKALEVARYLLRANLPLSFITEATGLSEAEIEALRE